MWFIAGILIWIMADVGVIAHLKLGTDPRLVNLTHTQFTFIGWALMVVGIVRWWRGM